MQIKGRCTEVRNTDAGIATIMLQNFADNEVIAASGPIRNAIKDKVYVLDGEFADDGTFRFCKSLRSAESRNESIEIMVSAKIGINKDKAGQIADMFGDDIFDYKNIPDFKNRLLAIQGIGEKKAEDLESIIKSGGSDNEIFLFLSENEIPYTVILSFLKEHGKMTVEKFLKNPYLLMNNGAEFKTCDRIAVKNGTDAWSLTRVKAVIRGGFAKMVSEGNTRMEFVSFLNLCSAISSQAGPEYRLPENIIKWLVLSDNGVRCYKEGNRVYVSSAKRFCEEKTIAVELLRLQKTAAVSDISAENAITCAEASLGIKYTDEQRRVFSVFENGGVSILTGGPGTGKTTVIGGIVSAFKTVHPKGKVLLCAPTGRAASRMAEISGATAKTIHKALNLKWYMDGTKPDMMDYDVIIADEMSMCDTELMSIFTSSIKSGTTVILSGDENQLPSVGPGQVLKDMLDSGVFPVYRLTKTIRQKEESLICLNADNLLKNKPLTQGDDFRIIEAEDNERVLEKIKEEDGTTLPQILVPIKKGKSGTFEINRTIQEMLAFQGKKRWIDGIYYHVGDKVIMNSNRYDLGYMNGDIGVISAITDTGMTIAFPDKTLSLDTADVDGISLSYALTVHKSQGSECDEVVIVLPEGSENMASRELLYTAVTRAKKKVTIISVNGNIDRFRKQNRREIRNTGLKSMLKSLTKGV